MTNRSPNPVDQRRQSMSQQPSDVIVIGDSPEPSPLPTRRPSASPDPRRQSRSQRITPQPPPQPSDVIVIGDSPEESPQPTRRPSASPDTRRLSRSQSNAPPPPPLTPASQSRRGSKTSIVADPRRQSVSPGNIKGQAPTPPVAAKSGASGRSQLKGPKFTAEDGAQQEINDPELLAFAEKLAQTIITSGHIIDQPGYAPIGFERLNLYLEQGGQFHTDDPDKFVTNGANVFSCNSFPDQWDSAKVEKIPKYSWACLPSVCNKLTQRTVQIFGRSGIGKTTACHWLNYKWAQGVHMVPMCMLFMFDVKALMPITHKITLTQLLLDYSVYSVGGQYPKLLEWLRAYTKFTTIFIDGAEELLSLVPVFPGHTTACSDPNFATTPILWLMHIIRASILPDATKYMFSVCHTDLVSPIMRKLFTLRFTMFGFSREDIEEFVKRNRPPEQAKLILNILKAKPLLMIYAQIPYFTNLLCTILQHETTIDNLNIETYSQLFAFLIMKMANTDRPTVNNPAVLGEALHLQLLPFSMLAFSKIDPTVYDNPCSVFRLSQMTECNVNPATDNIITRSGIFIVRKFKDAVFGRFCNYSMQELFGALYLIQREDVLKKVLPKLCKSLQHNMLRLLLVGYSFDDSQWSKTLRNCCGGEEKKGKNEHWTQKSYGPSTVIKEYVNFIIFRMMEPQHAKSHIQLGWFPLKMVFESQKDKFAEQWAKKFWPNEDQDLPWKSPREITISQNEGPFTTYDMMALPFVLEQHVKKLKSIGITYLEIESNATINLWKFVEGCKTMHDLNLEGNGRIDDEIIPHMLKSVLNNKTLTYIGLPENNITNGGILNLLPTILRAGKCQRNISFDEKLLLRYLGNAPPVGNAFNLNQKTKHDQKPIKDDAVKSVMEVCTVLGASSITELCFDKQEITDVGVGYLADGFIKGLGLKLLRMSGNKITDEGAANLARGLKQNNTLTFLGIGSLMTDKGAEVIAGLVKNKTNITSLHLDGNKLTDKGHESVIDLLKHHVVRLDIGENPISEKSYKRLGGVLKGSNTTILMVKRSYMTETSLSYIIDSLGDHKALTGLHLSNVNDGGATMLITALMKNNTLKSLALLNSQISSDLCVRLSHMYFLRKPRIELITDGKDVMYKLMFLPASGKLNYNRMELTDLGIEYLIPLLQCPTYGRDADRINLCRNKITHKGISTLGQGLQMSNSIKRVSMRFNNFGDAGCKAWADILTDNAKIQHIAIEQNGVTDRGLEQMLNMLNRNRCLFSLNLGYNAGMSAMMVGKFAEFVKKHDNSKTILNISFDGCAKDPDAKRMARQLKDFLTQNRPKARCISPQSEYSRQSSPNDDNRDAYLTNPNKLMGSGGFMGY